MSKRPPKPEYKLPDLTTEQQLLQEECNNTRVSMEKLEERLYNLSSDCTHIWVPVTLKYSWDYLDKKWSINEDWSVCYICGQTGPAFACEQSPVGHCEYDEDDRCRDFCIHCGNPEERK